MKNSGFVVLDASIKMSLKLFATKMEEAQARRALDRQRYLYEHILEQTLAGYWDWDIPSGNEYLSPTFKKMFGYEDNEMENRSESWQKIIFQEDLDSVFETYRRHVESGGSVPYYNEVRYHHKNGSTVWVICTGYVIEWDDQKKPKRMIGCHINITSLKQTEALLKESESKYRIIVENITDALFIHDFKGHIVDCNEAACSMTGYSRGELIGNSLSIIDSEENQRLLPGRMEQLMRENMIVFDGFHICKDGSELAVEVCGKVVSREGDGLIQGFVRDISERKAAEISMRKSEEKYRTLIETTDTGYVIIDANGQVLDANQEYVRLSGHDKLEDILGRCVLEWTAEQEKERNAQAVQSCFVNGLIRNFEVQYIDKCGNPVPIEINATALSAEGTVQIIGICRDITNRKHLQTEIEHQLSEKEILLREVHHRIKNNIANIKSLLSLQADAVSNADAKTALQDSINRIQSIYFLYDKLLLTDEYRNISLKPYIDRKSVV